MRSPTRSPLLKSLLRTAFLVTACVTATDGVAQKQPPRIPPDAGGGDVEHREGEVLDPDRPLKLQPKTGGYTEVPNTGLVNGEFVFLPIAAIRPRRLAPGQSGTLHVIVALKGRHVAMPGAHLVLNLGPEDGPLRYGKAVLQPARVASRGKYAGQPLYDDSILFEAPIQVAADAKPGKAPLRGTLEVQLLDGETGREVGLFRAQLQGAAWIGAPLPTPGVATTDRNGPQASGTGSANPENPAGAADPERPPTTGNDNPERRPDSGQMESPTTERRRPRDASADGPDGAAQEPPLQSARSSFLIGFGGLAVLVVVVLLLVLRRR